MKRDVKVFESPYEVAKNLSIELSSLIKRYSGQGRKFNLAISGGSTPKILFKYLLDTYGDELDWHSLNVYWVDERCVAPDSPESNFGVANDVLLKNILLPEKNIHRIKGEAEPNEEIKRYRELIIENVAPDNNIPRFDYLILGMGDDGHTASLFPGTNDIKSKEKVCIVTEKPDTKQKRISLTLETINNAKRIRFMVTGKEKLQILKDIFDENINSDKYPASHVNNHDMIWLIDEDAAAK